MFARSAYPARCRAPAARGIPTAGWAPGALLQISDFDNRRRAVRGVDAARTAPAATDRRAQISEAYAVERGALAATLDFILPSDVVAGPLRLTAEIWPQGGSDASPSDSEQVTVGASLLQTLRVRGLMVSYNGPNAWAPAPT